VAKEELDWLLIGRYALLITLATLIPIPLLDLSVENFFRRRMVKAIAGRHGVELPPAVTAELGNRPSGGCLGCFAAVVLWPFRKVLRTLLVVFQAKALADTTSEVVHRGLMLEEALDAGWVPEVEPAKIRSAMDRALLKVDTRPVERALRGTLRDHRDELTGVIRESVRIARERHGGRPRDALADAADADRLGPGVDDLSAVMKASIQKAGLVPEVLYWFRAAMGAPPRLPEPVSGAIEAAEILPPDAVDPEAPLRLSAGTPILVEDALEVADTDD
jgi:hypothetical protein